MGAKALFYWYVTLSGSTERDINLDTSTLMFSIFFNGLAIWPVNPTVHYLTVTANKIKANWAIVADCPTRNEEDWLKTEQLLSTSGWRSTDKLFT